MDTVMLANVSNPTSFPPGVLIWGVIVGVMGIALLIKLLQRAARKNPQGYRLNLQFSTQRDRFAFWEGPILFFLVSGALVVIAGIVAVGGYLLLNLFRNS
ncbi:MAG: hypothetical protein HY459_00260 [Parcubacteria group bacterium]|nr:hypothetical protein [Parcubacteria group bacterium]